MLYKVKYTKLRLNRKKEGLLLRVKRNIIFGVGGIFILKSEELLHIDEYY